MYYPNPNDPTQNYDLEYQYDKGGNRTRKFDPLAGLETWYHYDVDPDVNPPQTANPYGSFNNRLMYEELRDSGTQAVLSTTYYEYSADGNVTRVIAEQPAGGTQQQSMMSAGDPSLGLEGGAEGSTAESAVDPGDGGTTLLIGGGGGMCEAPNKYFVATRFGYAHNGQAVTFVHNESWCWNGVDACEVGGSYQIPWAREFRYDGARARYMNRALSPGSLMSGILEDIGTVWSDYEGHETYGDFTVTNGVPTPTDSYEPGLWRKVSGVASYLHNDMLGTLRQTTGTTGAASGSDVFTAFGEKLGVVNDRFGYVGAWGYQAHTEFPFLHVGARYYDSSSGRFLQRDPVGVFGGQNVFAYLMDLPSAGIDPSGLGPVGGAIGGVIGGGVGAVAGAALCVLVTKNPWAAIGAAGAGGTAGAGVGSAVGSGVEDVLRDLWNRPRAPLPPCASTFQGCGGGGHRW